MLPSVADKEFLFRELTIWGMSNINRDMILENINGQRKNKRKRKEKKRRKIKGMKNMCEPFAFVEYH